MWNMRDADWLRREAAISLERLWPRMEASVQRQAQERPELWQAFEERLRREWGRLFRLLIELYGDRYDFFYHLEQIVAVAARSWLARPAWLQELDARREAEPEWFQSQQMVGGVCYVDLF